VPCDVCVAAECESFILQGYCVYCCSHCCSRCHLTKHLVTPPPRAPIRTPPPSGLQLTCLHIVLASLVLRHHVTHRTSKQHLWTRHASPHSITNAISDSTTVAAVPVQGPVQRMPLPWPQHCAIVSMRHWREATHSHSDSGRLPHQQHRHERTTPVGSTLRRRRSHHRGSKGLHIRYPKNCVKRHDHTKGTPCAHIRYPDNYVQ
jgi:hypothetical protein